MGLDVADIGLDLKLFAKKSVKNLAAAVRGVDAMEEYIRCLEEEKGKIEVFKRELPLCERLLAHVIEVLKEEKMEKMKLEKKADDKMNWMSTAQLWIDGDNNEQDRHKKIPSDKQEKETESIGASGRGAFVPFKGVSTFSPSLNKEEKATVGLPDLSLLSPAIKSAPVSTPVIRDDRRVMTSGFDVVRRPTIATPVTGPSAHLSLSPNHHSHEQQRQEAARKARRCWSPELHRQFVAALHRLGGADVATPKQIRELMKVEGLTNDEVKSHLQKYRLHNRRAPNAPAIVNQSIVLVGGLWVPQEQSSSQSGSPQRPLQFPGSGTAISAATVGDSCEDEDGKSECYNWK